MSIEFVSGDLLNPLTEEAIAHGCNCLGVMGAGVAKKIRLLYPEQMFLEYRKICTQGKPVEVNGSIVYQPIEPGDVILYSDPSKKMPLLFNMLTQRWLLKKSSQPVASPEWIKQSLQKVLNLCEELGVKSVGMPRIGAGLGGLAWNDVHPIMTEICSKSTKVHFVVYETYKK